MPASSHASYHIKPGYRLNVDASGGRLAQYTDVPPDLIYQVAVYRWAARLVKDHGCKSVLEMGYGSGHKLVKYLGPVCPDITGIDQPHSVDYASRTHKVGTWIADDFDSPRQELERNFDFLMSVDVIEHLTRPEMLLAKIRLYAKPTSLILISTPERRRLYGHDADGPPANQLHIREWTQAEFSEFLGAQGLKVEEHRILPAFQPLTFFQRAKQDLLRRDRTCQAALCRLYSADAAAAQRKQ